MPPRTHPPLCLLFLLPAVAFWCGSLFAQEEPSALQTALVLEQAIVDAIAKAEKSVVAIARVRKRGEPRLDDFGDDIGFPRRALVLPPTDPTSPDFVPNAYATGVVIDAEGLILTTAHALGNPDENDYYVWLGQRPFAAKLSAAPRPAELQAPPDPWTDLALLKIEAEDLTPITWGDGSSLKKGQFVVALGNPYAIARDGEPSASWGMIANLHRKAATTGASNQTSSKETLHHYGTLIQTDARLNLGTSGGALINLKGEMIGLTTSQAAGAGYEKSAGFAIPVDEAFLRTIETLKTGKRNEVGFLGVAPEHLSLRQRQEGNLGARIVQIVSGTPAAQADLREGDVITHVNGEVIGDANVLIRELSKLPAESRPQLTVVRGSSEIRDGRVMLKSVELSKKFVPSIGSFEAVNDISWRGMRVDYATAIPNFQLHSSEVDPAGCIGVVDVVPDSPAWKAGLRPANFISYVGRKRISTPEDFRAAVAAQTGAVTLLLSAALPGDRSRTVLP